MSKRASASRGGNTDATPREPRSIPAPKNGTVSTGSRCDEGRTNLAIMGSRSKSRVKPGAAAKKLVQLMRRLPKYRGRKTNVSEHVKETLYRSGTKQP